jgi:hypothetical protein
MAEDDKDHTISSSSSESESLAHLVLGDAGENMSSDEEGGEKVVDMMCGGWIGEKCHHDGRPGAIYHSCSGVGQGRSRATTPAG